MLHPWDHVGRSLIEGVDWHLSIPPVYNSPLAPVCYEERVFLGPFDMDHSFLGIWINDLHPVNGLHSILQAHSQCSIIDHPPLSSAIAELLKGLGNLATGNYCLHTGGYADQIARHGANQTFMNRYMYQQLSR